MSSEKNFYGVSYETFPFEFTETTTFPYRGVINYNRVEVPFIIESFFNIWFNFKNVHYDFDYNDDVLKGKNAEVNRRIKKFGEDYYVDAAVAMGVLPCEFIIEIKNACLEKMFQKFLP